MKKTIWPRHPLYLLLLAFYLSIIVSLVIYEVKIIIWVVMQKSLYFNDIFIILGFIVALFVFVLEILSCVHNRAIIKDDRLIITGDITRKNVGLQFRDEILYEEVENVVLVYTHVNSRQRPMKTWGTNSMRAYLYFEFLLKNGESKLMYIESYSGRQRQKILDVFNEKAGLNLVYSQLEKRNQSVFQMRKKERRRKNKKENKNNSTEK